MGVYIEIQMTSGDEDLVPKQGHEGDAGFALHARISTSVAPKSQQLVPTGVYLGLPKNAEAQVRPRSGLAAKHGITVLNSPGTIDAGYRGEVGVILYNTSEESFPVNRGDRVAQMVIQQLPEVELDLVQSLSETTRGGRGFGSTGR